MHPELVMTASPGVAADGDALWYKDAIIYQVHVRAFFDSDGDGVGDFAGLTKRLDYIHDLGVTAVWVLPFFPSPLRDDGFDIADYTNVNPRYGDLRDFRAFLKEAKRRDLRVITELVMNHTSDQHPWFQRSRRARPGSKWRDFYVWSDNPNRYTEARVIFQDFEPSNWTWDPVANAYFWHRFYHHQPDLNFDNPDVRAAIIKVVEFWLEMGIDGLRLDAVPYLFEREGTNCENLPETHDFLKSLRRHIDGRFHGKMLLAEANQWPEDAAVYFGDGDECHMNFHFPLMPRLFMAVEREDRFPIIDILDQTPVLPESCQWGIFLRNHDELTLEMVTDEDRDYMYRSYAADPQARVNLGIRRRLAPLLRNNRRKIELMTGLLLSLPGAPIIYYGDEIGMGDNIYLGDRDGVRTPMQWSADRNSGFSHVNPQKLFLPVNIDPDYHYATRNVEVQQNSPHSQLWWMRRIINLRKQLRAFSRGRFEVLLPENPKVLVFLRQHDDETLLVVANLSRFAQCAEIDLARFRGQTPVELFGQTRFPPIGELPYFLTLGPYGFYWFQLKWREQHAATAPLTSCRIKGSWDNLFQGRARGVVQKALAGYIVQHRWFAGKARTVRSADLADWYEIDTPESPDPAPIFLLVVRINYTEGEPDTYLVPAVVAGAQRAANIVGDHPAAAILNVEKTESTTSTTAVLCEATWEKEFWFALLDAVARRRSLKGQNGEIKSSQTKAFRRLLPSDAAPPAPNVHGGQQSNTSAVFGDRVMIKLFRRLTSQVNPDLEIGRFLTETVAFDHVPDVAGALESKDAAGETMTLAVLHEFVPNEGDAWVYTLDELGRYLERAQTQSDGAGGRVDATTGQGLNPSPLDLPARVSLVELAEQQPPQPAAEVIGSFLESAGLLGRRTAEMHLALASRDDDPVFASEPFTKLYQRSLYQLMRTRARTSIHLLRKQLANLAESARPEAERVLAQESRILERFREVADRKIDARRIRCHGDFHLGQVLFTGKDFVIIDFEGEPDRTVGERRIKASPLRDVAGMVRSLHYASHAALLGQAPGMTPVRGAAISAAQWAQLWYVWSAAAFMRNYLAEAGRGNFLPASKTDVTTLLNAYLLEKALYELSYELNNRPDWVKIPLEGILQLLD